LMFIDPDLRPAHINDVDPATPHVPTSLWGVAGPVCPKELPLGHGAFAPCFSLALK
jgi:hypothetical protein